MQLSVPAYSALFLVMAAEFANRRWGPRGASKSITQQRRHWEPERDLNAATIEFGLKARLTNTVWISRRERQCVAQFQFDELLAHAFYSGEENLTMPRAARHRR